MKSTTALSRPMLDTVDAPKAGVAAAITRLFKSVRRAAADRALQRQLADMDDALLRDIGLSDDEIYRVRRGQWVASRHWA